MHNLVDFLSNLGLKTRGEIISVPFFMVDNPIQSNKYFSKQEALYLVKWKIPNYQLHIMNDINKY